MAEEAELKTAYQIALEKIEAREPIPRMTHPYSRHWDQPDRKRILIDDTHALMTQEDFEKLADYSATIPTGVYEGKMWKRLDGCYDADFLHSGGRPEWLLMWYGPSPDPEKCSINHRKILVV